MLILQGFKSSAVCIHVNQPLPDLRHEHRTEPVPPQPHRLMADIDAALEQNVLDLAQRQRIPDIHHHRQADDFGRRVEITEQISHPQRLRTGLAASSQFGLTVPNPELLPTKREIAAE